MLGINKEFLKHNIALRMRSKVALTVFRTGRELQEDGPFWGNFGAHCTVMIIH